MHIIILSRALPFHSIGGMQVITWDLAKAFALKGIKVTCITTKVEDKPAEFTVDGVNIIAIQSAKKESYSRSWWNESKQLLIDKYLNDCDVLFSVSASGFEAVKLKPYMKNTKFIFQGHGTSLIEIASKLRVGTFKSVLSIVKNIKWIPIDIYKYTKFDGIIASGERVFSSLQGVVYQRFINKTPVTYLPNGIFTQEFYPSDNLKHDMRINLGLGLDEVVFLLASRLHAQKGIIHALKGLEILHKKAPNFKVLIVGDGPDRDSIQNYVDKSQLSQSVIFTGAVSIKKLPHYINAADAYIFPTLHEEGLPLLPLEALACGLPVFASEHLTEIKKLPHVSTFNPKEPECLAGILLDFLQISPRPKSRVSLLPYRYSMDGVVESYLTFFNGISSEKRV